MEDTIKYIDSAGGKGSLSAVYDWDTFKKYHGGIEGARFCFEALMEELLRKENPSRNVQGVRLAQGDGGIDVFVGNIGQEKIDVYQCKYFDAGLRSSQWKQITDSYNRAVKNLDYQMNKWILCLPAELSLNEHIKWEEWKKEHKVDEIYSSYDRKTDSLINRLKHLYTLQKMTAEEQELLEKFALTPNLYVPFQYREWAGIKKDKLVALINRGWIDKSEDGYKMHPLIKESIIQQEVISISTFEELIDSISNDEFWHCNDEYNKRLIKKQIAKKIIDYFIDVDYKKIWNVISQYCQICLELSDYREAITVLKHAYELCDAEENPDEEDLLTIKLSLAYSYFHACDEKNALYYLALIDKRIEKIQDNDDKLFEIYNLHIILESRLGKIENAKQYFNKICELKITERDFLTAVLNYTSGLIQDKKTDDAMFYMMKFKERFEKEYSNHEAYLATFYSNLAIVYADKDDFQQALAYDQKAYDIRKQVLGTYSKDMAITYISLAEDCLQFNRNDEAKECIIKAEEICKAIFENEDNELYQKVLHVKYVLGI